MEHSSETSLFQKVQAAAKLYPNSIALADESTGKTWTYAEIMRMVRILAKKLKYGMEGQHLSTKTQDGVPTPLVCILMDRSHVFIVSILAVLSIGAAYVPIDPSFPEDRQLHILNHSRCPVAIIEPRLVDKVSGSKDIALPHLLIVDQSTLLSDDFEAADSKQQSDALDTFKQEDHNKSKLAYVLYTSGSTGKPKGVMVRDSSVCNLVSFFASELRVTAQDAVLGLTTFCFDISVLEIFLPLFCGAKLVLASSRTQKNPFAIVKTLQEHKVTIFQATPTTYEMLLSSGWQGDMNLFALVGGEACRPTVAALAGHFKGFYNVYGPTETTIWSSCKLLSPSKLDEYQRGVVPVGDPLWNTSFHIVSEEGNEVIGEGEGELWIGGDGVALGYIHAPELTAERFVVNPFPGPQQGKTAYRTGDLFRRTAEGEYVFVRRLDDQVKVAGYRIELAEVERACMECVRVKQALAVVVDNVIAVLVTLKQSEESSADTAKTAADEELRNAVRLAASTKVPPYMLPSIVKSADIMPMTANGKLDRRAAATIISEDLAKKKTTQDVKAQSQNSIQPEEGAAIAAASNGTAKRRSMTSFVMEVAFNVSGQELISPSASFIALGIDSFAAMLFRRSLDISLGGYTKDLDGGLLYDPDTTVATYSVILFDHMKKKAPHKLEELGIVCVRDEEEEDNTRQQTKKKKNAKYIKKQQHNYATLDSLEAGVLIDDNDAEEEANEEKSFLDEDDNNFLRRLTISKSRLLTCLRGFVTILIVCDHFFANEIVLGNRYIADTTYFVLLTGFTTGLQDITATKNAVWKPLSYLYGRFLGLFPIYWLVLLLTGPYIYINYPAVVSQNQLGGLLVLYALGLQEWTQWCATLLINVYYVSVLWGVFCVFACMKSTWLWSKDVFALPIRLLFLAAWIGFLIGMDYYIRGQGMLALHAPMASFYFGFAFFSVNFGLKPMVKAFRHYSALYSDLIWLRYAPGIIFDLLVLLLLYISYGIAPQSHEWLTEVKDGIMFTRFNQVMLYFGNPIIFMCILLFAFVQLNDQQTFRPSFLCYILVNSRVIELLGQCSLAIYLLQLTFMRCYYPLGIMGVQLHQYPYTRKFFNMYNNTAVKQSHKPKYYYPGIVFIVLLGIFVQKCYQDQLVARTHLWLADLWQRKVTKKNSSVHHLQQQQQASSPTSTPPV